MKIDTADLDVMYISYDEPDAEENWADLVNKVPWAERVHGVKGSNAAHKAAAEIALTNYVVTIDGDNIINEDFFNNSIEYDNPNAVYSWRSVNNINGLTYGNGGIKIWPKNVLLTMQTHEDAPAGNPQAQVDFCWDQDYIQMHDVYSRTYQNGSKYQAWRAGFREGVKLTLVNGERVAPENFLRGVHKKCLEHLEIWMNVGADVTHGRDAMIGAMQGCYMTMLTDWDFLEVRDFDKLEEIYKNKHINIDDVTNELKTRLGLNIIDFDEEQSKFFKKYYNRHVNKGFMVTEMDVIRQQEKW